MGSAEREQASNFRNADPRKTISIYFSHCSGKDPGYSGVLAGRHPQLLFRRFHHHLKSSKLPAALSTADVHPAESADMARNSSITASIIGPALPVITMSIN